MLGCGILRLNESQCFFGELEENSGIDSEDPLNFSESGWWGRIISCCQIPIECFKPKSSQQDILDDIPVYIGQANVTATEAVGQLLVVDPEQVQNGGVEIVYL